MGQTIAEKILFAAQPRRDAGEGRRLPRRAHRRRDVPLPVHGHPPLAVEAGFKDGFPRVWDTERFYLLVDHHQPALAQSYADENVLIRKEADAARHQVLPRRRARHRAPDDARLRLRAARRAGRRQRFAHDRVRRAQRRRTGITRADMLHVLLFGELWFQVPQTVEGRARTARSRTIPIAKDIILHLAGLYGDDFAQEHVDRVRGLAGARALHRQPHVPRDARRRSRREVRDLSVRRQDEASTCARAPTSRTSPSRPTPTRVTRRRSCSTSTTMPFVGREAAQVRQRESRSTK